MKKNDIAIVILIVSVTLTLSYLLAKAIIGEPKNKSVQVEVVEPISTSVEPPSGDTFNKDAINPTVPIQIGNPSNQQPFGD
jgi:hypothetical protein